MITLASRFQRASGGALQCLATPCGSVADFVLAASDASLFLLPAQAARRTAIGDPRALTADLHWDSDTSIVEVAGFAPALLPFAAAMVAALQCGAMQRVLSMSLDYCNQRVQFGKPLGKFQAIQQQLSVMAEHVLASMVAAESAFCGDTAHPRLPAAAIAKARTSEAGSLVAASAHAVLRSG